MGDRCPVCGRWDVRPAVVDGILVEEGKLLLIRRGHEPCRGRFALPGGFIDRDETAREAVVREMREETGLDVEIERFLGFFDDPGRDVRETIALVFVLRRTGGEVRAGDDAVDFTWADPDDPPPLAFDHARVIAEYRASLREG
ncbi:MAG: NUDIX hydrolase [Planctomycetes bacterium]|nr:NUDIX hydrolase [Planctomycetota bacterium]